MLMMGKYTSRMDASWETVFFLAHFVRFLRSKVFVPKYTLPGTGISFVLIIGSEIRLHEMAKHENTALSKKHILSLFWVFG